MTSLALSPGARHAARLQAAAPDTYRLFCRVVDAKAAVPVYQKSRDGGHELTPLYRRLRALEIALALALECGRDVSDAMRWNVEAVCRRAEAESRGQA